MCGIVGAVAQRDVAPILLEGLKRLEYRGYDSAGMAVIDSHHNLQRHRALGKVRELEELLKKSPLLGNTGIAHTRWATHGKVTEENAHPHFSGDEVALVHNGIIENYEKLREQLAGYELVSETDSEIVAHLVHQKLQQNPDFLWAVREVVKQLEGAYAIAFMHSQEPGRIIAVRSGCPLVVGMGIGEYFIASDHLALLPVAQNFMYLEEGDVVDLYRDRVAIYDAQGNQVERKRYVSGVSHDITEKGKYRHYMLKEIFEQPESVSATLQGRINHHRILEQIFGDQSEKILSKVERVQIVACGTSYHAGLVARYWLEEIANIPCNVEIASEIRYRKHVVEPNTLYVTLSQSGETADTLGALRSDKNAGYLGTLAICNAPESSLVRESDLVLITRAGPEIGVASTKAFTTQLVSLLMLTIVLARYRGLDAAKEVELVTQLETLPKKIEQILMLEKSIKKIAETFSDKRSALFIGRGLQYPIALEGALKLKEISYIHAEAYPAGELKHGALALVDHDMPVIALVPADEYVEKIKSNLQEIRARGGDLIVFADDSLNLENGSSTRIVKLPEISRLLSPILYTIPMQLLAYYVAIQKGTDVDQPRNLAKSVTVE